MIFLNLYLGFRCEISKKKPPAVELQYLLEEVFFYLIKDARNDVLRISVPIKISDYNALRNDESDLYSSSSRYEYIPAYRRTSSVFKYGFSSV